MFDMYDVYRGPSVDRDVDDFRNKFIQLTHDTQIQARQCTLVRASEDSDQMVCSRKRAKNPCSGLRSFTKACQMG